MAILTELADVAAALRDARTIAVLGAHDDTTRPAFYVPDYLHQQGYRLLPVNPELLGKTLWGEPVVATVTDLTEGVDLVDVFRNPRHLRGHLDELLAMQPRPRTIWFQAGVRDDSVARALAAAGLDVVQDRCVLADHRRFGLGRRT
jgi:uncharacterized protein